jgi:hypothetical protein
MMVFMKFINAPVAIMKTKRQCGKNNQFRIKHEKSVLYGKMARDSQVQRCFSPESAGVRNAECAKLETREVRLLRRNDMYSVGIFCKKCGSKLEVVDEFKEGTKKDWFVNPCEICTTRNAELPVAPDKDDTTNASWTECDVCSLIHDRKKTRCSLDILQRSS